MIVSILPPSSVELNPPSGRSGLRGLLKRQAFFAEELSYIRAHHAFMPDKIGILFFTAAAGNPANQEAFPDFPICTRY
jgi:hypothetical protein